MHDSRASNQQSQVTHPPSVAVHQERTSRKQLVISTPSAVCQHTRVTNHQPRFTIHHPRPLAAYKTKGGGNPKLAFLCKDYCLTNARQFLPSLCLNTAWKASGATGNPSAACPNKKLLFVMVSSSLTSTELNLRIAANVSLTSSSTEARSNCKTILLCGVCLVHTL